MPTRIILLNLKHRDRQTMIEQALACADKECLAEMNATTALKASRCAEREKAFLQLASSLILSARKEANHAALTHLS